MSDITPCLWFDTRAEEAARFYTGLFDDAEILQTTRYGDAGPGPAGAVMTVLFRLRGRPFLALNGGPQFTFNEAVSFQVFCRDQEEVDRYWDALGEGGRHGPCGWLTDRFGLSWQIIPEVLPELIADPDPARAQRAMAAMLGMGKLDVAALTEAADRG